MTQNEMQDKELKFGNEVISEVICKELLINPHKGPFGCPGNRNDCGDNEIDFDGKCTEKNLEFKDELRKIENHKEFDVINNDVKSHLHEVDFHSKLVDSIENFKNDIKELKRNVVELKNENILLQNEIKMNKNKYQKVILEMAALKNGNTLKELNLKMDSENKEMKETIMTMETRLGQITQEIDEIKQNWELTESMQIKMIEVETKNTDIYGEFEWKIENFFKQKMNTDIYSESFYTHKYGYKMCLWARISDILYVDFCLMRGEFDNYLPWPFKHGFIISLINPRNSEVYKSRKTTYTDFPNNNGWLRPTERINKPIYLGLLEIEELLKNSDLTFGDQLTIKCKFYV